jgi:hypothetical protein
MVNYEKLKADLLVPRDRGDKMSEAEKLVKRMKKLSEAENLQKKLQEDRDREAGDYARAREKRVAELNEEQRNARESEQKKKALWPSYPVADEDED